MLFGATAGVGLWVAHFILQNTSHNLSVVCRDQSKLERLLKDDAQKIKNVTILDVENEAKNYSFKLNQMQQYNR